jgi:hypothetical protein
VLAFFLAKQHKGRDYMMAIPLDDGRDTGQGTPLEWILFTTRTKSIQVCVKTGIHPSRFSMIKNGYCEPTPNEKESIAGALGLKATDIFYPLRVETSGQNE